MQRGQLDKCHIAKCWASWFAYPKNQALSHQTPFFWLKPV